MITPLYNWAFWRTVVAAGLGGKVRYAYKKGNQRIFYDRGVIKNPIESINKLGKIKETTITFENGGSLRFTSDDGMEIKGLMDDFEHLAAEINKEMGV